MNRKRWIVTVALLLIVLLLGAMLAGCSRHKITVISGERFVHQCPKHAKTGDTVTVTTSVVHDGELYVNGVDGRFVRLGEYQFVMPDHDVELKVTVIAFPNGS